MTKSVTSTRLALAVAMLLTAFAPAGAAFIDIDDSDLNTITITAGDFEGGFFVGGVFLTSGAGNSASVTLPDDGYAISGQWDDLGATPPGSRVDLVYSFLGSPFITSGVESVATAAGNLQGSVGGFSGIEYFFSTASPLDQAGGLTSSGSLPSLSVSFVPEAVPEPAAVGLTISGLAALAARRRRR